MEYFNSRPSARGDEEVLRKAIACIFQFTPLREGRRGNGDGTHCPTLFQFTPLREGRRERGEAFPSPDDVISIHAPPRGATEAKDAKEEGRQISIHAPPRGATTWRSIYADVTPFQFTPLREGRPKAVCHAESLGRISIHAPPRGATSRSRHQNCSAHFNSRPSARGDRLDRRRRLGFSYFNSRPSARGDNSLSIPAPCRQYFNSRPSARGDSYKRRKAMSEIISIHAPPRGATLMETHKGNHYVLFQFTPLREGRPRRTSPGTADDHISIHAPPRGATVKRKFAKSDWEISIHAPPRGATSGRLSRRMSGNSFQFTPLREGRRQKICNFCKSFVQPLQISMA